MRHHFHHVSMCFPQRKKETLGDCYYQDLWFRMWNSHRNPEDDRCCPAHLFILQIKKRADSNVHLTIFCALLYECKLNAATSDWRKLKRNTKCSSAVSKTCSKFVFLPKQKPKSWETKTDNWRNRRRLEVFTRSNTKQQLNV